jgi:1-acyl-sn-glycerol-3-phosphate acyltransferase
VVVANHGSFVDGLVLILSLRAPTTYVVGTAFAQQPLLGRFLSGLGCVFAGGGSPSGASEVIDQLTAVVRGGSTLVIFPEGGLSALPGLRRFRLGAFRVAAAAGVEVVPVGVRGTRAIVPPRQRRARPGAIVVEIGAPIMPAGTDWRTVVALRDTAQRAIALLSGEVVPQA